MWKATELKEGDASGLLCSSILVTTIIAITIVVKLAKLA
jgi:hypothetical protein